MDRFVFFVCLFVCLLACLFVCLFVCLFLCFFGSLFLCFFCLFVLFDCLFVCLFVFLFVCLFLCLFVCLFVCLRSFAEVGGGFQYCSVCCNLGAGFRRVQNLKWCGFDLVKGHLVQVNRYRATFVSGSNWIVFQA